MGKIVVIGLGPGDMSSMTLETVERVKQGDYTVIRTDKHPTVQYLRKMGVNYVSYDKIYEKQENFEDVYQYMTEDLVYQSKKYDIINYCVPGNPYVAEMVVAKLIALRNEEKIQLDIVPGVSFIDKVIGILELDPSNGLKIIDGLSFRETYVDMGIDNIITQVYNKAIASEIKIRLMEIYEDNYRINVVDAFHPNEGPNKKTIPLYELDRRDIFSYTTYLHIPKIDELDKKRYDMNNLLGIMEKLRSEEGCPWDIKQTHQSLREFVLEEAYEVVEAIDSGNLDSLVEELGDLLLQVIFHSQIGKEEGYFNIWDITSGICRKLLYRHPHVFGEKRAEDVYEAKYNWDEMKKTEKNLDNDTQRLRDLPKGLCALMKSFKVQERGKDVGFDWDTIDGPIEKVKEEFDEVMEAYQKNNQECLEEELGDLLFAMVNVCRFMNINPEVALNKTVTKFIGRFEYMEKESVSQGKKLRNMTFDEMNRLWDLAKIHKIKKKDKK